MNKDDISEIEKTFSIKLPETYIEAEINCPTKFDEIYTPILIHSKEHVIEFNERLRSTKCITSKGNYFGVLEEKDNWYMIDLSVNASEVIFFDKSSESFEEIENYESIKEFVEHLYNQLNELYEMDNPIELSDSEIKEKFYEANTIATYINFSELLGELFEDLEADEFERVVIASLKDIGIDILDSEKLYASAKYFMEQSDTDIYSLPGYQTEYHEFEKHM